MRQCLFISDLHLSASQPQITRLFQVFMQKMVPQAEALYILGDFFDVWLGDDAATEFQQSIMQLLKHSQTPIYFLPGNRDFLIGQQFAKTCQLTLLPDPATITLYGKQYCLKHGDDLCWQDKRHCWFRRISRSRVIRQLFLGLPLSWRARIAGGLKKNSRGRDKTALNITDATDQAVLNSLQQSDVNTLIHGHTHRPSIRHWFDNQLKKTQIVLSDWFFEGNCLQINDNNEIRLFNFNEKTYN